MGRSGDVTISNLKSATSIADDRLSAHHPNGTSNNTRFGNFLVQDVGGNLNPGTTSDVDSLYVKPDSVFTSTGTQLENGSGSYNNSNLWQFDNGNDLAIGYIVYLVVWYEINDAPNFSDKDGVYAQEQIFHPWSRWGGVITRKCKVNSIGKPSSFSDPDNDDGGTGYFRSMIELEVTDDGGNVELYFGWNADLNTDMPNAGNSLAFATDNVQGASSSFSVSIDSFTPDCGNNETWDMKVECSVSGGTTDYSTKLNRDGYGANPVDTKTVSSDGSFFLYDSSSPDLTSEQTYELVVTDDNGNGNTESTDRTWKFLCQ